ncbi:Uma2 family endonuclease [Nostoc sp.]|uniref:Uma2 family endonuclease n=1 Tax=Nostoc sp. TaxID=1180 RepID=UPI003FA574F7
MNQPISERVRWTTADLELFPDNGNRYEIIDGELFVTKAPHWKHQKTCVRISTSLDNWSQITKPLRGGNRELLTGNRKKISPEYRV